jgi:hypothetical protein
MVWREIVPSFKTRSEMLLMKCGESLVALAKFVQVIDYAAARGTHGASLRSHEVRG